MNMHRAECAPKKEPLLPPLHEAVHHALKSISAGYLKKAFTFGSL